MKTIDCLIVEDSPTQALKLQVLLERKGYSTDIAQDGAMALQRLKEIAVRIVISDIVMPKMDGYELCKQMKATPGLQDTSVLLLTTLSDPEDIFQALECGADNFIIKPADETQLLNRIEYLIANRKVSDTSAIEAGLEVNFGGQRQFITSSRLQILNLLLSTYDVAVRKNRELQDTTEALQRLNEELERKVEDRTRHLVHEIEERKAVELSNRRLAGAIQQSEIGLAILDDSGEVTFSNRAMMKILDQEGAVYSIDSVTLGKEESSGLRIQDAWHQLRDGAESGYHGVFVTRAQNGREAHWDVRITRVIDEAADKPLYMLSVENVSDRRRLEMQVRRKDRLESIGTLAGGIAHDFNNILAAVLGYAEFGLEDLDDAEALREDFEQIRIAGIRAQNLVQQILRFGKSPEAHFAPTRVDVVVKEALELLRATLPKSIEIRTKFEEADVEVMGDSTQIHQLAMNLCTNAQHAMELKSGILEIRVERFHMNEEAASIHPDLRAGDYVRLVVSDTGHGMSKEIIEQIFDPFFTTKDPGRGTGLGMSTCHSIVRDHRGAITVYSELGKGTTFQVYLPAASKQEVVGVHTEDGPVERGSERILVVDDEEPLARMLQRQLENAGYRVAAFSKPEECLAALHAAPQAFDLLISDATMPNMSGLELAEAARAVNPDLPVIIVSGLSNHIRGNAAHVDSFLTKPVSLADLRRVIRELLTREPRNSGGIGMV